MPIQLIKKKSNIILSKKIDSLLDRFLSSYFVLHFSPAPVFVIQHYMLHNGNLTQNVLPMSPKTYGGAPVSSDNEGPNPNANGIPTFFTTKHYKWLLKYQQLFHFYLGHGHTNLTRANADNSNHLSDL
jgi:hypothetical protein